MGALNLDNPSCFPDGLDAISTPAFVYDERAINRLLDCTDRRCEPVPGARCCSPSSRFPSPRPCG